MNLIDDNGYYTREELEVIFSLALFVGELLPYIEDNAWLGDCLRGAVVNQAESHRRQTTAVKVSAEESEIIHTKTWLSAAQMAWYAGVSKSIVDTGTGNPNSIFSKIVRNASEGRKIYNRLRFDELIESEEFTFSATRSKAGQQEATAKRRRRSK